MTDTPTTTGADAERREDDAALDLDAIEARARAATLPAPGFPGYEVDAAGCVWSSSNWRGYGRRQLMPFPNGHGYPSVKLKTAGRMKKALIHVLVCTAFHGIKPTSEHQVRHLNGKRDDNRAENLAWGTIAENAADRKLHGTEKAAVNGRSSAHKLVGRRKAYCLRGHLRVGNWGCPQCRREKRTLLQPGYGL